MIQGIYDLVVYCDHPEAARHVDSCHWSDQFIGLTRAAATRDAVEAGWSVNHKTGRAICPKHRKVRGAAREAQ